MLVDFRRLVRLLLLGKLLNLVQTGYCIRSERRVIYGESLGRSTVARDLNCIGIRPYRQDFFYRDFDDLLFRPEINITTRDDQDAVPLMRLIFGLDGLSLERANTIGKALH